MVDDAKRSGIYGVFMSILKKYDRLDLSRSDEYNRRGRLNRGRNSPVRLACATGTTQHRRHATGIRPSIYGDLTLVLIKFHLPTIENRQPRK